MSDSVVVNVISPEVTNINVTDTGENIYINPLTLNQGIINHSVTHQSGGSDELLHNLLGGLQGGSGGAYYHLTSGQYFNLTTGAVVRPSDTGAFYPNSNPSGFITGVNLSGYVTGDVVRPSETGNFITTSQTGAFYPRSNPSGFISSSQTGAFYASSNPSGFITGVDLSAYVTGAVVRPSETGAFYPTSNPSGFITGVDLSAYVTGSVVRPSETGNFITFNSLTGDRGDITVTGNSPTNLNFSIDSSAVTNTKIADGAITTAKIANFNVTTDKLGSLAVTTNIIASNAVTNTKLADMASQRIKGRISAGTSDPEDLTASQVRTIIDFDNTVSGLLSGYVTGSVVRPSETGAFYAASNPSGFITGVDLSFSGNYYTKSESESRYVNTTGTETILGDKTFHDRVYINNLYVTGLETIVNTTNTNVASNFIMLNLTGGAVDGGLFFVTGSGLTGINDSGAILGFDHSDKFKFGIGTRASDLSVLDTIASVEEMTGISGGLQTQINSLSNATGFYVLSSQTGAFYPISNPSGYVTGSVVRPSETGSFITSSQTGVFYPTSNPSGFVTGLVVRPSETGSFITTAQTGAFYPTSNPSGYITGVDLSAYVTGSVVRPSETGNFITSSQTGAFYSTSNPSGFVTGSVVRPSETGNFLTSNAASFTSDTLATALSDENGTGGGFTRAEGASHTNPTINTSLTLNATGYNYGAGARQAMLNSMSNRFVYKDGLIPFAEIFDDFPTTLNGAGTHRWATTAGTVAYYTNGSAQSRFWGAISLTTAATIDASSQVTAAPSGGANGQTSSRIGLSVQTCFCINSITASEFRFSLAGGGASFAVAVLFSTGVIRLESTNIGGAGINTLSVATGLSLAAGNFISGTRYRLFYRMISQTQTEVYFASAPWDSSTWTTLVDTIVTHSAWSVSAVSTQPFITVTTKEAVAKIAYLDWVAIRQEIQR